MKSVEAIFGGILALIVLGAAIFMVAGGQWGGIGGGGGTPPPTGPVIGAPVDGGPAIPATGNDVLCQCFDQAFALAGENVGVMSSQYRTGFESCRAVAGARGGDAWTAGWNARVSSKPFQASCGAWLRRG
ncbi:MAG: hypothetical protein A3E78_16415 [Alphaproteobacteria bacterium RIFCSPHIGHO2_12_FULL_63_12]|nr:MAG: hypothetical protein A3E78_16415 [Alphaproteobacteria bacterium RIFCSPHIGHO2_12_FULL_63_12]